MGQAWSRACPFQHGASDSAGAYQQPPAHSVMGTSLAHQPALGGSHYSSPSRQGSQGKGAPTPSFGGDSASHRGKYRPVPVRTASHGRRAPPPWAGTHRPSQNPCQEPLLPCFRVWQFLPIQTPPLALWNTLSLARLSLSFPNSKARRTRSLILQGSVRMICDARHNELSKSPGSIVHPQAWAAGPSRSPGRQ